MGGYGSWCRGLRSAPSGRLLGKRLVCGSLGTDVRRQTGAEALGVCIRSYVGEKLVLKKRCVKLGAVPGLHFVCSKVSKRRNTTCEGGGRAARGRHGREKRVSNLCVCVLLLLLLNSLNVP